MAKRIKSVLDGSNEEASKRLEEMIKELENEKNEVLTIFEEKIRSQSSEFEYLDETTEE